MCEQIYINDKYMKYWYAECLLVKTIFVRTAIQNNKIGKSNEKNRQFAACCSIARAFRLCNGINRRAKCTSTQWSSARKALTIAVIDKRPYVLDHDKEPKFEGIIRSSLGIPYTYNTATQQPMSQFLTDRLVAGLKKQQVAVESVETTPEEDITKVAEPDESIR